MLEVSWSMWVLWVVRGTWVLVDFAYMDGDDGSTANAAFMYHFAGGPQYLFSMTMSPMPGAVARTSIAVAMRDAMFATGTCASTVVVFGYKPRMVSMTAFARTVLSGVLHLTKAVISLSMAMPWAMPAA